MLEVLSDKVFFGLQAADIMQVSRGILGVYEMRLYVNDKPHFAWQLDSINYNITRYMNAQADYKTVKQNGPWIQLIHNLPNDKLPIYKSKSISNGIVNLVEGLPQKIRIEALDSKGNMSSLEFYVKKNLEGEATKVISERIKAGKAEIYKSANIALHIPREALYDDIHIQTQIIASEKKYSYKYQLHHSYVPLRVPVGVILTPKIPIPNRFQCKVALKLGSENKQHQGGGQAAWVKDNRIFAMMKNCSTYQIVIDTIPPKVISDIKNNDNVKVRKKISFDVSEETTHIASLNAFIGKQRLRLVQKHNTYTYEMDEHFPKGKQILTLFVSDENHNVRKQQYTLIN